MIEVGTLEQLSDCIDFSYHLARDDFDGRKGMAVWAVTITCAGRSFTTEYSMGCDHRVYTSILGRLTQTRIVLPMRNMTIEQFENQKRSVPIEPVMLDVMCALVSDAECVEYSTFEEFCYNLGFSDDSIKDKGIYGSCCKTATALRSMGFRLDQLSELFQDY